MKIKNLFQAAFLTAVCFSFSSAQDIDRMPTIETLGTAEVQAVPDEVYFSLRVEKTNANLETAKTQNDENVRKILELTRRYQIPAQNVKTDYITVKEKFDKIRDKDGDIVEEKFAGYTVSKNINIKLTDIGKFESLFSEIAKIGVTEIRGVSFNTSALRKHKDAARAMAIRAAKEKAAALAGEIGQTIGKAVVIEEENVDGYRSPYANASSNNFSASDESGNDSETLAVGTISIKAQVKVKFLLN